MVRDRLDDIEDELERHHVRMAELRAEKEELLTTQRVLARLHSTEDEQYEADLLEAAHARPNVVTAAKPPPSARRKPSSLPSVNDMIIKVLEDAREADFDGLEPRVILAEIQRIWWPDATTESVGPIAWRMSQQGRLEKTGSVYSLPKSKSAGLEGPADPLASEQEGGGAK